MLRPSEEIEECGCLLLAVLDHRHNKETECETCGQSGCKPKPGCKPKKTYKEKTQTNTPSGSVQSDRWKTSSESGDQFNLECMCGKHTSQVTETSVPVGMPACPAFIESLVTGSIYSSLALQTMKVSKVWGEFLYLAQTGDQQKTDACN